eukprot:8363333-Alexandrium_andersonii.AAC.1
MMNLTDVFQEALVERLCRPNPPRCLPEVCAELLEHCPGCVDVPLRAVCALEPRQVHMPEEACASDEPCSGCPKPDGE